MAALTTDQIECLLNCIVANSTHVLGAFPANCVPIQCAASATHQLILQSNLATVGERHPQLDAKQHYCFILNTHTSDLPGEHWLAFFFNGSTQQLEYFDSFDLPLAIYTNVKSALDSHRLLPLCVRANTLGMIQAMNSAVCGHYCVAFLFWRATHTSSPLTNFAHTIMNSHTAAQQRDMLIVARLRAVAAKHPCCRTLLSGHSGSQTPCISRFSQSCCCCRDSYPSGCTHI